MKLTIFNQNAQLVKSKLDTHAWLAHDILAYLLTDDGTEQLATISLQRVPEWLHSVEDFETTPTSDLALQYMFNYEIVPTQLPDEPQALLNYIMDHSDHVYQLVTTIQETGERQIEIIDDTTLQPKYELALKRLQALYTDSLS